MSLNYSKIITFAIPCYNSAEYMDHCIESLLELNSDKNDIEIIIVDDGSTKDFTLDIAKGWEFKYPKVIRAIHQENGGHGQAVNTGLANANGLYFKVVDSDDWLDSEQTKVIMEYIRKQFELVQNGGEATDLIIGNYVYNKVYKNIQKPISYSSVLPTTKEFTWNDIGKFKPDQCLLMHTIIYKTQILHDMNFTLPKHTFYVDNIFAYVPLVHINTIKYFDVNMYMYFIGREDQSVNEKVMLGRIDQQLKITKIMIDNTNLDIMFKKPKLAGYMLSYLSMMMCICTVFLRMKNNKESKLKLNDIWQYVKSHDERLYKMLRGKLICFWTNIPGPIGRRIALSGYKIAQNLFSFN